MNHKSRGVDMPMFISAKRIMYVSSGYANKSWMGDEYGKILVKIERR